MDSEHHAVVPELAGLSPRRIGASAGLAGALAILALVFGASYVLPAAKGNLRPPPSTAEELSGGVVTVIPYYDAAGIKSALAAIDVPEASRAAIERSVLARERQMAWIVFTDSMDPDGDVVAVRASGLIQNVVLSKAWTPVAVALSRGAPIEITGVRDGMGGGITVALATRSGPVALRSLQPGEKLEVMP